MTFGFGSVVVLVIGIAFLTGAYFFNKNKRKGKSNTQRVMEVYKDYQKDMQKFKQK